MLEIEISSGSEDDTPDIAFNMDMFQQMINLCRSHKQFPQQYVEDMNKMYKNCSEQQKNSKQLCNLVLRGIEFISPKNKESFQYAADVYNELLQLSKKDPKTENYVASTSNGNSSMASKLENGTSNNSINDVNKIFKELIEKCYQNPNYPNSNIDVIDKLYKSLPLEFLDSKYFVLLLKEANIAIWPDSGKSLYVHIEHIYDQLQQFETSMKVQDSRMSADNKQIDEKKMKKLKQLKTALKNTRKQIKALDVEEMDIENDDEFDSDSAYIMKDKYEKRIVQIYKRMCQLTEEPDFLEEPVIRFKATNNSLVNKTIEKYYNLNKTFPDYFEIYTLLKCLRDKKKLGWTENELINISHDAFLKLGKQLKLRRLNEYFGGWASINTKKDPAEENEELRKKLDASSKKLHSDLSALEIKFNTKQDYAEETDGSNLNDTDCELSSDNESTDKSLIYSPEFNNKKSNKEFKPTKPILVKRKQLTSDSEKDGPPKKSQKTIYMESFNLRPRRGTLETIHDEKNVEITVNSENFPCQITYIDNVEVMLNKNNSIDTVEDTNKVTKTKSINIDNISNEETSDVSENDSIKITNHVDNIPNKKNKTDESSLENDNLSTIHFTDIDEDGILVIDEGIKVDDYINKAVAKKPQNKIKELVSGVKTMNSNTKSIDSEDNDPIITEPEVMINKDNDPIFSEPEVIIHEDSGLIISEPEVIIHEDKELTKDIIEINEHDDSDVEITSCEIPIVPVQNRKSLETIIKSMNFDKKYKWNTDAKCSNSKSPQTVPQNPGNVKQNMNHNLVNRWVMNNIRPPPSKPKSTNNRHHRQLSNYQNVQSTFQKSVQTARQVTQCVTNMVQQQRNVQNNQSVRVTTMTTTTTVRQIVKNNQAHRSATSINNNGNQPELIELD